MSLLIACTSWVFCRGVGVDRKVVDKRLLWISLWRLGVVGGGPFSKLSNKKKGFWCQSTYSRYIYHNNLLYSLETTDIFANMTYMLKCLTNVVQVYKQMVVYNQYTRLNLHGVGAECLMFSKPKISHSEMMQHIGTRIPTCGMIPPFSHKTIILLFI
jgi:hypothetical protein